MKKVLIIEDSPEDFEFLKNWAESMDFSVLPTNHKIMAKSIRNKSICDFVIQQIKGNYKNIELILCDIMLGKNYQGGNQVVRCVRDYKIDSDKSWTSKVPIFGVTQNADLLADIINDNADDVIYKDDLKNGKKEKSIRNKIIKAVDEFEKYNNIEEKKSNNKKVFIVHGHGEVKQTVARFIEKLGLEAVILQEKPNSGYTIIEKIEHNTDVGYAVVLYTGCDEGKEKNETEFKPRARQNVVFEHGYMICKLGRNRVCALLEKNVECPSDLAGILYISLEESDWRWKLANEMKDQGMDLDLNKL